MSQSPNILFLLTDQQRYDSLGCNGATICQTPAIDSIAASGMRFSKAYTPIALCSPARGSLLTGLYPHNHGQLSNMGNFNGVFSDQILDKPAYPQLLKDSGYNVSCIGKWHLAKQGDTEFWGYDKWHPYNEWHQMLKEDGIDYRIDQDAVQPYEWGGNAPFYGELPLPVDKTMEAWTADKTIDLLNGYSDSENPFMIAANFFGPHFPYAVPEPYLSMYDPDSVERWGNFDELFINKPLIQQKELLRWNSSHLTWEDWQKVIAAYWGFCTFIDDQVQRILNCLEENGLDKNTIVIFSTDHGDMLGSHRLFNKGFHMYEETHHIPLVIRWNEVTAPGSTCNEFVNLVDLMPTFLEIGNAPIPDNLDGRSIVPLLKGDTVDDWNDDVFAEFHGYEPTLATVRMVRTDNWKYVYNPYSEDELYDMKSDPHELHNLANHLGFKHVLRRMKDRMVKWLRETEDNIVMEGGWQSNSFDLLISDRER